MRGTSRRLEIRRRERLGYFFPNTLFPIFLKVAEFQLLPGNCHSKLSSHQVLRMEFSFFDPSFIPRNGYNFLLLLILKRLLICLVSFLNHAHASANGHSIHFLQLNTFENAICFLFDPIITLHYQN